MADKEDDHLLTDHLDPTHDLYDRHNPILPLLQRQELSISAVTSALNNFSFSSQLPKFHKGEDFSMHCARFSEHVALAQILPAQQFPIFLQSIQCDQTYSLIRNSNLSPEEKRDSNLFLESLKNILYGQDRYSNRNILLDSTQSPTETISEFVFRLRQQASIAFSTDRDRGEETCFLVFLRGLHDQQIRRKLNEMNLNSFSTAIREAEHLERVSKMFPDPIPSATTNDNSTGNVLREKVCDRRPKQRSKYEYSTSDSEFEREKSPRHRNSSRSSRHRSSYRSRSSRNRYRSHSRDSYPHSRDHTPPRSYHHSNRRRSHSRERQPMFSTPWEWKHNNENHHFR